MYNGLERGSREGAFLTHTNGLINDNSVSSNPLNNFIQGCKADGNWYLMDCCWMMAQGDKASSKRNLITPGIYDLVENGPITHTPYQGLKGNGSSSWLDTNFNPSILSNINYTRDSASCGFYSRSNVPSVNQMDMCASTSDATGNGTLFNISGNAGSYNATLNSSGVQTFSNTNTLGMFSIKRNSSLAYSKYINNNNVSTVTGAIAASVAIVNMPFVFLRLNSPFPYYSTRELAFAFIGGGGIDIVKLYSRVQTYLSAYGKQV